MRLLDIWYACMAVFGIYMTYHFIYHEVHIFWVIVDMICWVIIGFAPTIWRHARKGVNNG